MSKPWDPYSVAEEVVRLDRLGDAKGELFQFLQNIPWEFAEKYYRSFLQVSTKLEGTTKIEIREPAPGLMYGQKIQKSPVSEVWRIDGVWPKHRTKEERAHQIEIFDEYVTQWLLSKLKNSQDYWELQNCSETEGTIFNVSSRIFSEVIVISEPVRVVGVTHIIPHFSVDPDFKINVEYDSD